MELISTASRFRFPPRQAARLRQSKAKAKQTNSSMKDSAHTPPRDEFLTARQLAAILQVSETTVRRLANRKRIPSMRIAPRILRFNLEAVRAALEEPNRSRTRKTDSDGNAQGDLQLSFADLFPKI